MNVLIVDDHALFRVGLEMLLTQLVSPVQVTQATSAQEALDLVRSGQNFDLVLLDWNMPSLGGLPALLAVREAMSQGRVVILSGEQSPHMIRECIDHGAAGFIPKDSSTTQLTEALHVVAQGGIFLPPLAQFSVDTQTRPEQPASTMTSVAQAFPELTPRQVDVLQSMARGLSNKLIARDLGISEETVKQHLSSIYQSLSVRNRTEAVYVISRRGIRVA